MPPFGKEKSEPSPKPLPFLSQRTHDPKPKNPAVIKAFQEEPEEPLPPGAPQKPVPAKRKFVPFQEEHDEEMDKPQVSSASSSKAPSQPFREEGEESGESSSDEGGQEAQPAKATTIFSLGWQSIQTFVSGTFWKEGEYG